MAELNCSSVFSGNCTSVTTVLTFTIGEDSTYVHSSLTATASLLSETASFGRGSRSHGISKGMAASCLTAVFSIAFHMYAGELVVTASPTQLRAADRAPCSSVER
ncbi:hypothetical protein MTO96_050861 [Rhipicephalus appendiculatus]